MSDHHAHPDAETDRTSIAVSVVVLLLLTLVGAAARSSEAFSDAPTVGVAPAAAESR